METGFISAKDYENDSWQMEYRRTDGAIAKMQCRLRGTGMMSDRWSVLIHYPPEGEWARYEYPDIGGSYSSSVGKFSEAEDWLNDPANGFIKWSREIEKELVRIGQLITIRPLNAYRGERSKFTGICTGVHASKYGPIYQIDTGEGGTHSGFLVD